MSEFEKLLDELRDIEKARREKCIFLLIFSIFLKKRIMKYLRFIRYLL